MVSANSRYIEEQQEQQQVDGQQCKKQLSSMITLSLYLAAQLKSASF